METPINKGRHWSGYDYHLYATAEGALAGFRRARKRSRKPLTATEGVRKLELHRLADASSLRCSPPCGVQMVRFGQGPLGLSSSAMPR